MRDFLFIVAIGFAALLIVWFTLNLYAVARHWNEEEYFEDETREG